MKMMYNGTQIKSLNVNHYELSSNDCDMIASDLQAGKTAVARGKKITGTGKSFSFASYGNWTTNESYIIPMPINTIQVGSVDYPIKMTIPFKDMKTHDFITAQKMADATIDGVDYPITVSVKNNKLIITCERTIEIQLFIGKDEYV